MENQESRIGLNNGLTRGGLPCPASDEAFQLRRMHGGVRDFSFTSFVCCM